MRAVLHHSLGMASESGTFWAHTSLDHTLVENQPPCTRKLQATLAVCLSQATVGDFAGINQLPQKTLPQRQQAQTLYFFAIINPVVNIKRGGE